MMFIFSSTHYELFKQNILNACCYPIGHLMRVRYEEKYVPSCLRARPQDSLVGKTGVFVYGEGAEKNKAPGDHANLDYQFYPIRRCKIKHAQNVAGIIMLDLELRGFVDYGEDESLKTDWNIYIKRHRDRPLLKVQENAESVGSGFYVYDSDDLPGLDVWRSDELAWRSVVDRINSTELASCVTYRVTGFFRMNQWPGIWRLKPESRITPSLARPDPIYPLKTGETILVKLLFYGQANRDAKDKVLELKFDKKSFTSASKERLPIDGRYNEERILLPTVRGTDSVLSALSITQGEGDDAKGIWAPQPSFVVSVRPSKLLVAGIVVAFTLAFFFASLSKLDELSFLPKIPGSSFLICYLNPFPKVFGALFFLSASWQYLRKFPLK